MAYVRLVGLDKNYGKKKVLDRLNLEIEQGELLVILGPSGHGKSKTLEIIAGLEKPDQGEIYYGDNRVNDWSPLERNIGIVFQDYALFPHLTVEENILFGLKVRGKKIDQKDLDQLLELLELEELIHRFPRQLSGGQQQRVALARALVIQPRLLLLDEPFSALDAQLRHTLQRELKSLQKQLGITTICVTHDQGEAYTLGDRVAILHQGKIIRLGKPREIFSSPKSKLIADFLGTENVYQGKILQHIPESKELQIGLGNHCLCACNGHALPNEEETFFWIKPQEVVISKPNGLKGIDKKNILSGKIKDVIHLPLYIKIYIDIGGDLEDLVVNSPLNLLQDEGIAAGAPVEVAFTKESIEILN